MLPPGKTRQCGSIDFVGAAVSKERSGLEIYEYAAAEAREAGEHYYGIVTPDACSDTWRARLRPA